MAEALDDETAEKVLSRMTGKLAKRFKKEKLTKTEALAIQLELEDELLQEWRKNYSEIRASIESKQKKINKNK